MAATGDRPAGATEERSARSQLLLSVRGRPGPDDGEGRERGRDRNRAQLLRRAPAPGRRQGLRQGVRAGGEAVQPAPCHAADEANQPAQGPRRGSALRAHLLGRGARDGRRAAGRHPLRRPSGRVGLSEGGRELRRRRHAAVLHGHVPGISGRVGRGGHGVRLGAGREVLPLRASLRRTLAPRVHRVARHAADQLPDLLRRQRRSVGRRGGRVAARQCPRARHAPRAGRAAPLGDRRLLGAVGADQAEDRRGLSLCADACPGARDRARAARPGVPARPHVLALPGRAERLLPARARLPQTARLGYRDAAGGALRHLGRDARAGGQLRGAGDRDRGGRGRARQRDTAR